MKYDIVLSIALSNLSFSLYAGKTKDKKILSWDFSDDNGREGYLNSPSKLYVCGSKLGFVFFSVYSLCAVYMNNR